MGERNVKLVLSFDPHPEQREAYFQFFMCEFVPTLELLGLRMSEAWHTAYGEHPLRLSCFLACEERSVEQIVASSDFIYLEEKLQKHVLNYTRRIVQRTQSFQV